MESRYLLIEEEQEMGIDVRDMLASVIMGWKILLCGIIAGMLLLGLVGIKKSMGQQTQSDMSIEEKKIFLRNALSETDAVEVEKTFAQYQVYQNYISNLSKYSSAYQTTDPENKKMKIVKYYVVSSVKNSYSFFTEMALSSENYEKIYEIAYSDSTENKEIEREQTAPLQFFYDYNWENSNYIAESDKNNTSKEATLITAFIIAEKEEQCEEIQKVMDQAFAKEVQTLREVDPGIVCKLADAHYSKNGKEYFDKIERNNVDRLNVINNALVNLKNNFIDKFSGSQKNYFDFLKDSALNNSKNDASKNDEKSFASTFDFKKFLKYIIFGAALGFFLTGCWLIFSYIIEDHMKTSDEMGYFGISILGTFYYEKTDSFFSKTARKIRGINPVSEKIQEQMLVEDIAIMMKRENCTNLYLFMTSDIVEDEEIAIRMQKLLREREIHVNKGNPLSEQNELKLFSESDKIVFIVHIKETKRDSIKIAKELCGRYHSSILGAVAIEIC